MTRLLEPFVAAQNLFAVLKADFLKGLNNLSFKGDQGNCWQINDDGMSWFKWDGKAWLPSNPKAE
jgi:hypothetical protein